MNELPVVEGGWLERQIKECKEEMLAIEVAKGNPKNGDEYGQNE